MMILIGVILAIVLLAKYAYAEGRKVERQKEMLQRMENLDTKKKEKNG
tara:strand:+ start:5309 stop:5452 length:144 start_codon:yes stop_codon:yes gene_type:complete